MAQYSDLNILESNAEVLCFSAASVMTPVDIHGKRLEVAPMEKMSALASALYQYENKLSTIMAGQIVKARLFYQQHRIFLFMVIKLEDNRFISPFIVRKHTAEPIDPGLVVLSTDALFRWLLPRVNQGIEYNFALERPIDATPAYDKLVALLPDYVTIHQETRYETTDKPS